ncbi:MAG: DUF72 domain-containing protein [Bdellovibrionota bacterium]
MGKIRVGTVGFSYRDWSGVFYPVGAQIRRQLNIYENNFGICELTQFVTQMPDRDRIAQLVGQLKGDLKFFVRLHNSFTHTTDIGLAMALAKHYRKAFEPLMDAGKFSGFVASFPYAFKNDTAARDYLQQLNVALEVPSTPLQLDFRHPSWQTEAGFRWLATHDLGFVCVDEPQLPGLVPPLVLSTSKHVLVRFHGRNREGWWSGNPTTRYDYFYSAQELDELILRYEALASALGRQVESLSFVFQNHWQAQAARNALQWKSLVEERYASLRQDVAQESFEPRRGLPFTPSTEAQALATLSSDDDPLRPPTSLPMSEVKSRVTQALSDLQVPLELPQREF